MKEESIILKILIRKNSPSLIITNVPRSSVPIRLSRRMIIKQGGRVPHPFINNPLYASNIQLQRAAGSTLYPTKRTYKKKKRKKKKIYKSITFSKNRLLGKTICLFLTCFIFKYSLTFDPKPYLAKKHHLQNCALRGERGSTPSTFLRVEKI